jgi:hypothetical protein
MGWGKVTITVIVTLETFDPTEEAIHIGFRGAGGWYEPSNDLIKQEIVKQFKARKYTGPHYVDAITTKTVDGANEVAVRSARTVVGVGGRNKTAHLRIG